MHLNDKLMVYDYMPHGLIEALRRHRYDLKAHSAWALVLCFLLVCSIGSAQQAQTCPIAVTYYEGEHVTFAAAPANVHHP